jgi:hypothetical protein
MALEGVKVVKVFLDNATVWFLALVYNAAGSLADPTAVKITIIDPDGTTQVDAGSMTQYDSNTGIYEYKYHKGASPAAMDAGRWRGRIDITDGTGDDTVTSPYPFSFEVKST